MGRIAQLLEFARQSSQEIKTNSHNETKDFHEKESHYHTKSTNEYKEEYKTSDNGNNRLTDTQLVLLLQTISQQVSIISSQQHYNVDISQIKDTNNTKYQYIIPYEAAKLIRESIRSLSDLYIPTSDTKTDSEKDEDVLATMILLISCCFSCIDTCTYIFSIMNNNSSSFASLILMLDTLVDGLYILYSYQSNEKHCRYLLSHHFIEILGHGLKTILSVSSNGNQHDIPETISIFSVLNKVILHILQLFRGFISIDLNDNKIQSQVANQKILTSLCQLISSDSNIIQESSLRLIISCTFTEFYRKLLVSEHPNNLSNIAFLLSEVARDCPIEWNITSKNMKYIFSIVSKTSFILSNLTTSNTSNRLVIGKDLCVMHSLTILLQECYNMFKGLNNDDNDDEVLEASPSLLGNVHDLYEVSIAILRLLANLSIHEVIGNELSSNFDIFQILLDLLDYGEEDEELLLHLISTCTNLTYYLTHEKSKISTQQSILYHHILPPLARKISFLLFHINEDILLESLRCLGNLTRLESVLLLLLSCRIDEVLLVLLQHKDVIIVTCTTGVLVNYSRFHFTREMLFCHAEHTIEPLDRILQDVNDESMALCTMICQILFNLLSHPSDNSVIQEDFKACIPKTWSSFLRDVAKLINQVHSNQTRKDVCEFLQVSELVANLLDSQI